uniref:C4-type zinc ribbon domain-containing protein n=1 Tax=Eiseniibacteriota bacterium TaxID=2212470 RepID=A0A832I0V5_UNCEI
MNDVDILWSLHGLDEERITLRAALARVPEQRRQLEARVAAERAALEAHRARLAEVQRRRRAQEQEIEALAAQERQFQSQQPSVKTNEAYQALTHEIATVRGKRSDLETQVLLGLEEEEALALQKGPLEEALRAAEAERDARLAALATEESGLAAALEGLDARRVAALEGLTPAARVRYERVHASRDGRAVVAIAKGACGGCFRAQPPQLLQEAKRRDRVLACEGCGRLLVLPPEGEPA